MHRRHAVLGTLPALFLAACIATPIGGDLKVGIPGGIIEGALVGETTVFRGVPFAAPPVGDLRWRAPQPVKPWSGVRDATLPAPGCIQDDQGWNRAAWLISSEDCLTLDVHTRDMHGKAPVMVFIHGGANREGSSGIFSGSSMMKQGIVGVDIQYRLGALGFLSHPGLSAEQGGHSGNYGVMDQVAALQWVKHNIDRFGGDPDNITIFGSSAGAFGVSLMLAVPGAQGLFDKAIMQSGNFKSFADSRHGYRSLADAEKLGLAFAETAEATTVRDLRRLSPVAIVKLQGELQVPDSDGGAALAWVHTTIDGKVLQESAETLIAQRAPKPVILGTNKAEFGIGSGDEQDWIDFWQSWNGRNGDEAVAAYLAEPPDPRRGDVSMRIGSDIFFHCPTDNLADLLASFGWPVWRYELDVGLDSEFSSHSSELRFVFDRREIGSGAHVQDYWAALAITGDPNGATGTVGPRPTWERWYPENPRQIRFTAVDTAMEAGKPRAAFCALR